MERFSGERAIPEMIHPYNLWRAKKELSLPYHATISIWHEHQNRYKFASKFTRGAKVLDVASGVGYGGKILRARNYVGVDIDHPTVAGAKSKHKADFVQATASQLPFENSAFDTVVSFETIEHLHIHEANDMLTEINRVLEDDGTLIISTPNRNFASPETTMNDQPRNPFHRFEVDTDEWQRMLSEHFGQVEHFGQGDRTYWNLGRFTRHGIAARNALGHTATVKPIQEFCEVGGPNYFVSVCTKS